MFRNSFFHYLKLYLGFSSKESRGFVLVVPFLLLLIIGQFFYLKLRQRAEIIPQEKINAIIDSLEASGFKEIASPLPISSFVPDTSVKASAIKRISFSEADSITLQIVPGIGPATASRIIKYKVALGGMHSKSQLLEVFGVTAELAEKVWEFFEFESEKLNKLSINTAEVSDLARHPYIGYGEAKVIVAYRAQHGSFTKSEDLLAIKIFREEWVEKISPYLEF